MFHLLLGSAIAILPGIGSAASVPLTYETAVPPGGHGELDTPAMWVSPSGSSALLLVVWIVLRNGWANVMPLVVGYAALQLGIVIGQLGGKGPSRQKI